MVSVDLSKASDQKIESTQPQLMVSGRFKLIHGAQLTHLSNRWSIESRFCLVFSMRGLF